MRRNTKIHEWQKREKELIWDRQSIHYWNNEAGDDPLLSSHRDFFESAHMLISDVSSGIIPRGHSRDAKWNAILSPCSTEAQALLAAALDRDGRADKLEDTLQNFMRECVTTILSSGEAPYEIVPVRERDSGCAVGFRLSSLQAGTLFQRQGQSMQYIPLAVAKKRDCQRYMPLSPQRIIKFVLPLSAHEKTRFRAMMECLEWQSHHLLARFWMKNYDPTTPVKEHIPFDISHHIFTQALAEADVAKQIGYNARGKFGEHTSEFYSRYRELKFQGFVIQMRNAILDTLNDGLEKTEALIGSDIGFLGRIRLEGLPTLADVEAAQKKLQEGKVSVHEVLVPFRGY